MLSQLLRRGEGSRVAILPEPDDELLAETLVAFANADGGTILVGINPAGRPTGGVTPEEMEGV